MLFALGVCYSQLGRKPEAIAVLRSYVKLMPASPAGHALLGMTLLGGSPNASAEAESELEQR